VDALMTLGVLQRDLMIESNVDAYQSILQLPADMLARARTIYTTWRGKRNALREQRSEKLAAYNIRDAADVVLFGRYQVLKDLVLASFKGDEWTEKHGRSVNYKLSPDSPEKEIYWRQFLKLYEGVTMSAFGTVELIKLDNPAYQGAVDLFLRYAGQSIDPVQATRAWMVFSGYTDSSGKNIVMRNVEVWISEDDSSKTEIVDDAATDYRAFMLGTIKGTESAFSVAPEFRTAHKGKRSKIRIEWLAQPDDAWELWVDGNHAGNVQDRENAFHTEVFEFSSIPASITIRKKAGNPKFHILEVCSDD